MRKILIIVGIVVFFFVLLGLVVIKLFPGKEVGDSDDSFSNVEFPVALAPTGSTNEDPDAFTKSFYEWYLSNVTQNPSFPYFEDLEVVLEPWLTPEFISSWDEAQIESEANPILLTAESSVGWGTDIEARVVEQSVRTRSVYVSIGPTEPHAFFVLLTKNESGEWRISSITNAP